MAPMELIYKTNSRNMANGPLKMFLTWDTSSKHIPHSPPPGSYNIIVTDGAYLSRKEALIYIFTE